LVRAATTGRMPINAQARARLRQAQRQEAARVSDALRAASVVEQREQQLAAAIAEHEVSITEAKAALGRAQAKVVEVSGMDRAALLLDETKADLRAACSLARQAAPTTKQTGDAN
jgi:hypothetical protein